MINNANPPRSTRQTAVVLAYESTRDSAPRLVAKGQGEIADRIIATANEHGLPIHKDPELVRFLMQVDIEEKIPATLYAAVAHVLALVWRAEAQLAEDGSPTQAPSATRSQAVEETLQDRP